MQRFREAASQWFSFNFPPIAENWDQFQSIGWKILKQWLTRHVEIVYFFVFIS